MTIVGTRPEIIRLSRVINKLDRHCSHTLVHTGQNYDYELNEVFFVELAIRRPDHFLQAAGATPAQTIGKVIMGADEVLERVQPDALLLLGDTNSALAAIAAKRRRVPIFHMEAGNRCFDFRVPEEINRRIVDHIADINLTYSRIAREYLLREGLPPDQVICTGSPMREVLEHYRKGIDASDVLARLGLAAQGYFLVSSHREENVDSPDNLTRLFTILNTLADRYGLPVIVSTHPRTRKRLEQLGLQARPGVQFCKPFGFLDYVQLQLQARAVLSDSGTITEESSILNFPALNLREVHERPEGFEESAVMMVGLDVERVLDALAVLDHQPRGADRLIGMVGDYQTSNVSDKVLRILLSYTDFVNRRVWHRG
ncbi:MAG: UDP-N-acetylglucosamine 2-epimerase [Methylibium sp. NZG]|nr:MAG: UDP-N-acetylglucosamine 2-epimerase [Methylibium sp. NZG]